MIHASTPHSLIGKLQLPAWFVFLAKYTYSRKHDCKQKKLEAETNGLDMLPAARWDECIKHETHGTCHSHGSGSVYAFARRPPPRERTHGLLA